MPAEALDDEFVPSRIPSTNPHHVPRQLTAAERQRFRETAQRSMAAKAAAVNGEVAPIHPINKPRLNPETLMPQLAPNGLRALSLFSGGGGLDLGFERAGYSHVASYEVLKAAAETLISMRPNWTVLGGEDGDVKTAKFSRWRGLVDVVHGGPPCQPFSIAGRQKGDGDERNLWPDFVRCVRAVRPKAFIAENVPALASKKFADFVDSEIIGALEDRYHIRMLILRAEDFGVPQIRRRVVFVGFSNAKAASRFEKPAATHRWSLDGDVGELEPCMGVREALGLQDNGFDDLSPTIRSTLTGPRHTTSILNSTAAQRVFANLGVWPNGVALTREAARAFPSPTGDFRLAVPDVALLQGFPEGWRFNGPAYMQLGQIGNAVPPPMAYAVAKAVSTALV
ncbi:DNA cytosine methyltransferase [Mycolicibacter algericus]|uniref:DNA cytosine methyltransferase n=2 Tax=Mycolicibacter algericus TaxID=1288388 RepID=UPI003C75C53A